MARRILLADDSVTAQNMGRRILTDAGYEVITVNNGSAALKKISEQKPDLIVLDVYMPGYGGLEVCQRLKETPETARIPVLLSVGKLEPFKPDEAKRVRADAFIVKPFEASELLTALTKLEDKIVPQAQPHKAGRFARAMAAVEQAESGERYGDKETGWKNRLAIPSPSAPSPAPEVEVPEPVAGTAARALEREEGFKPAEPAKEFERPLPSGVPSDITAEEIAAISAAAATFGGKKEETAPPEAAQAASVEKAEVEKAEPAKAEVTVETPASEALAATLASAPPAQAQANDQAKGAELAAAAEAVGSEAAKDAETAKPQAAPATSPDAEVKDESQVASDGQKSWTKDAEVLAAIASLAPVDEDAGNGQPGAAAVASDEKHEEVAATVAGIAGAGAAGPRWIAEAVAVTAEESALFLEREMEKALAALAAAEAGRASVVAQALAVASSVPAPVTAQPEAIVAATPNAADLAVAPETMAQSAVNSTEPALVRQEAAYAAAASAGPVAEPATVVEPAVPAMASANSSNSNSAALDERRRESEAELAAAWQNWKQIRETLVGPELTSQIADAAAAELASSRAQEASRPQNTEAANESTDEDVSSDAGEEPAAIASIVESVLAELKPKLVEEIARKMNSQKKSKQKKGKK